ncbi:hypothetical protein ABT124_05845 [Streptomyces sp. NPDC001982]|uniref:DUF6924 domain-containing protein n=1 Tax=unclassified Streptomyces TaxID=2593676 RepID=UPI0033250C75
MSLPQPADLTTLVLRTDFADDAAWQAVRGAIEEADEKRSATFVSDPRFDGASVQQLLDAEAAAAEDDKVCEVFVADAATMTDETHPLLAVDLFDEPGRTFRVPVRWFPEMSANLSIANADFADYADAAGATGTFQGFGAV